MRVNIVTNLLGALLIGGVIWSPIFAMDGDGGAAGAGGSASLTQSPIPEGVAGYCAICLDTNEVSPKISTQCKHFFHKVCLLENLKTSPLCPLCRSVLELEKEDWLNLEERADLNRMDHRRIMMMEQELRDAEHVQQMMGVESVLDPATVRPRAYHTLAGDCLDEFCDQIIGGYYRLVELTLKINRDIDINRLNREGLAPLHLAVTSGNAEITRLLLAHPDININVLDRCGITPLVRAVYSGDLETVRLLINDSRTDRTIRAIDGQTALDFARQVHRQDVVDLFEVGGQEVGTGRFCVIS